MTSDKYEFAHSGCCGQVLLREGAVGGARAARGGRGGESAGQVAAAGAAEDPGPVQTQVQAGRGPHLCARADWGKCATNILHSYTFNVDKMLAESKIY